MFKLGPPVQIAYAVNDAHQAADQWAKDFGAGPFFIAEHIPVTNVTVSYTHLTLPTTPYV